MVPSILPAKKIHSNVCFLTIISPTILFLSFSVQKISRSDYYPLQNVFPIQSIFFFKRFPFKIIFSSKVFHLQNIFPIRISVFFLHRMFPSVVFFYRFFHNSNLPNKGGKLIRHDTSYNKKGGLASYKSQRPFTKDELFYFFMSTMEL